MSLPCGALLALPGVMYEERTSLKDTARGIGVRAAMLAVAGLVIGGWLTAFSMKVAGKLVHLMVGLILLGIGGGIATLEVRKLQRKFEHAGELPPAAV